MIHVRGTNSLFSCYDVGRNVSWHARFGATTLVFVTKLRATAATNCVSLSIVVGCVCWLTLWDQPCCGHDTQLLACNTFMEATSLDEFDVEAADEKLAAVLAEISDVAKQLETIQR